MKLILTGTVQRNFNRMLGVVGDIFKNDKDKVVIQYGFSDISHLNFSKNFKLHKFINTSTLMSYIRKSNMIIVSSGEVTAIEVIKNSNTIPIFFPRLQKYREHVDDQQLEIAEYFYKNKLAFIAKDKKTLLNSIKRVNFIKKNLLMNKSITDNKKDVIVKKLLALT